MLLVVLALQAGVSRTEFSVRANQEVGMVPACYLRSVLISGGHIRVVFVDDRYQEAELVRAFEADELARLRRVVDRARFFGLPREVGCLPTEASERYIVVDEEHRAHAVRVFERGNHPTCLSSAEMTNRAFAVWDEIQAAASFAVSKGCRK
jgi:hypothetical protein